MYISTSCKNIISGLYSFIKLACLSISTLLSVPLPCATLNVIIFNNNGEVIPHRIIKLETNDEINYYITKGDNNTLEDNEKVEENQIKGKMVIKIPKMGNFIKALSNNIFLLIILLVILILSFIKILVSEKRDDRRKKRKIEEKRKS